MTLHATQILKKLEKGDVQLLSELEKASERYEWIPSDRLPILSEMPPQDVEYRLNRLNKFKLVKHGTVKYFGYKVLPAGYDALALWDLVEKGVLEAFGRALGIGKEADIYDAITPKEKRVAVKFNRLGMTFISVKEVRPYEAQHGWIDASKSAAKREFEALKKLHPDIAVPEPIARSRHVLVMGVIDGDELADVVDIDYPLPVLELVIENLRWAYESGVIHADLSEHNVLIKPDGEILIIDWPQWIPTDHPEAGRLLDRDVTNLLKYFRRKFGIEKNVDEVIKYIRS